MARPLRSSLWADVVLNLALLTVATLVLNGVLFWKVVQGRELQLRTDLAAELSRQIAFRVATQGAGLGTVSVDHSGGWREFMLGVQTPPGEEFFAVLTTPGLAPVATLGDWPREISSTLDSSLREAERRAWLVDATDLRAALAGRRTEQGQWQPVPGIFRGDRYAVASSPVLTGSHSPAGAVRVAVPIGSMLLGRMDRGSQWVLFASVASSALLMGLFGYVLFRRRILKPMEALVAGTKSLGDGDFDTRLPAGAANELGELASVFNALAAALEAYRSANELQVAELRRINEDLQRAQEDLVFAEKMATVGRLAAGVAHEVGNPLASVIGFVEVLERDPMGMHEDLLPRIRSELDRIHHIIRDLLHSARPEQGGETAGEDQISEVEVATVVNDAIELVQVQDRFENLEFELRLGSSLPAALCHPGRLQQVFLNLFLNAGEAMDGRGRVLVERILEQDPMLVIAVRDDGPGIDPKARSNIFEPFFTTKDVGAGTGLGLAVSVRLVETMGGTLELERDHYPGACFHLRLPIAAGANPP